MLAIYSTKRRCSSRTDPVSHGDVSNAVMRSERVFVIERDSRLRK